MPEINDDARNKVMKLQQFQQQMQALTMQKQTLQMQEAEIDNALKELGKIKTEKVFEIVGNILINKKPVELRKSLNEKKKRTNLRLESINKQLKRITNKAQELQKEVIDLAKGEGQK